MKIPNLLKRKSLAQQVAAIKTKYPQWDILFNSLYFTATGTVQPTSRSEFYQVRIDFFINQVMQIRVLKPKLIRNFKGEKIPHMYSQRTLCLYMPKYGEFKLSDYVCDTVIPWITLWLYYYEVWHATGEWLGGGVHPE